MNQVKVPIANMKNGKEKLSIGILVKDEDHINLDEMLKNDILSHLQINLFNMKYQNTEIVNQELLTLFLKESSILMLHLTEKQQLLSYIKKWSDHHTNGLLILSSPIEIGMANHIYHWLQRKGKKIEVAVLPMLSFFFQSNQKQLNFFLLGGKSNGSMTRKFRREIAKLNIPFLFTSCKETELISIALDFYYAFRKAFILDLEQIAVEQKVDVEVLKKGLKMIPEYDYFPPYHEEQTKKLIQTLILLQRIEKKPNLFVRLIYKKIKEDFMWPIQQIVELKRVHSINRVTVYGYNEDILVRLTHLPFQQIMVFTPISHKIHKRIVSPKIEYISDLYQAAQQTDLILFLSSLNVISTISLQRLGNYVSKKIIIDPLNLFEIDEMKALKWTYISKGRVKYV